MKLAAQRSLDIARTTFNKVDDPRKTPSISMADALMAGLAVYSLKIPSLLKLDQLRKSDDIKTKN